MKIITVSILIFILAAGVMAVEKSNKLTCPIYDQPLPDYDNPPAPEGLPPAYKPADHDPLIGDVMLIGTTWYDIQHNSTCGRQVRLDNDNYVHIAWMNGLNSGAVDRHVYYNLIDTLDNMVFPGGTIIDQAARADRKSVV